MSVRARFCLPLAIAAVALSSTRVSTQKAVALPDVLQSAAEYLVQYSEQLGAVAAEEQYSQDVNPRAGLAVRLVSDVVFLGVRGGSVIGYRDVVSVDGAAVHPRDDRLLMLFTTPPASALQAARRLADEGVRYYRSPNLRMLDQPQLALEYLKRENQERCLFKLDSVKKMNGVDVAIVKFNERNTPRLIPTPDNVPAEGRFWIEVGPGTIRQTQLAFPGETAELRATVTYAAEPKLGLWLPVEMNQRVDLYSKPQGGMSSLGTNGGQTGREGLEGRALYSKFRQVAVDLSKIR